MSLFPRYSSFPPVSAADRDGMLLVDDDLSRERLLEAYRRGIFPWPIVDGALEVVTWWSPDPRAILPLDQLHVSRRLRRRIRSGKYVVSLNRNFPAVISACAEPRAGDSGTWITPSLAQAYLDLHRAGYAHSLEVWSGDQLAGGLYGVALGGFFGAESMFHRLTDASKVALVYLVQHLRRQGFTLLDVQQWSPHLGRLGAREIPRTAFLRQLRRALDAEVNLSIGSGTDLTEGYQD